MICPKCKKTFDDDTRFCPECGCRLMLDSAPSSVVGSSPKSTSAFPSSDSAETVLDIPPKGDFEADTMDYRVSTASFPQNPQQLPLDSESQKIMLANIMFGNDTKPAPLGATVQNTPARRAVTNYKLADATLRDKYHIEIEYAVNRVILTEGTVNFCLRVNKLDSSLQEVNAWVFTNDGTVQNIRDLGDERPWQYNERENCFDNILVFHHTTGRGDIHFDYNVMCCFEAGIEFFKFTVDHHIIEKGQNAKTIYNTYHIERSNQTTISSKLPTVENGDDFIEAVNMEAPYYRPMLFATDEWRPEKEWLSPENEYNSFPQDRLTLIYKEDKESKDETYIQLCSKRYVSVGRSRQRGTNDIAIDDWTSEETFRGEISRTVSRRHGQFVYRGSQVIYSDFSRSGTGIWHQNRRIVLRGQEQNNSVKLPDNGIISFGKIQMTFEQITCPMRKRNRMCKCCEGNSVKAMLLRRYSDKCPEVFLFLWECFDLGMLFPKLAGLTVYHRNGSFLIERKAIRDNESSLYVLYPGFELELDGNATLQADDFFQLVP